MIQDGLEVREMTDKEFLEYEQLQEELALIEESQAAKLAARQAALDKLGLSQEEISALFG
jgi:multidrug efflux pump subunit AcrA (membrane-fusion protein)